MRLTFDPFWFWFRFAVFLCLKMRLKSNLISGESRDSGVSENHSRQSSEPFTNSSEDTDRNEEVLMGSCQKEGDTFRASVQSNNVMKPLNVVVTEDSANAKMVSIEAKIREQEEVLRVERELLHLEQEEIKRQRENLIRRENLARHELQHGAKMLMSANRRSLQDLNGLASAGVHPQKPQHIYANLPHQSYHMKADHRKSMSDLQDYNKSKRTLFAPPVPPSKPMRQLQLNQKQSQLPYAPLIGSKQGNDNIPLNGGFLVKIASPLTRPFEYSKNHHSLSNLSSTLAINGHIINGGGHTSNAVTHHTSMTRNTLHALSATPKPKYTDGWVQQRKSYDSNLHLSSNDSGWLTSIYQQKRKSVPEGYNYNSHWLVQEAEQRRMSEQQTQHHNGYSLPGSSSAVQRKNTSLLTTASVNSPSDRQQSQLNGKPLPDSIIQTLTERVQSKGIGDRKRYA